MVFPDGRVASAKVRGKRVIPAGVAYVVDKILQGNTRYGTAAAMPSYYTGTAAGKTGTTSNSADAWFCGFDPKLATAVWMGYPQAEIPMPGVQGATYCVPIWGTYYELVFGAQADPRLRATGGHAASTGRGPAITSVASPSPTPVASSPSPSATAQTPRPRPTTTPSTTPTPTPAASPAAARSPA